MSSEGVVKSWAKAYGFAEATTGEVVWIHKSELPEGMKLKVGERVAFDMEIVEGHGGRVKGISVSGPALISAAEEIPKEERAAARAEWEAFKKEKIAVTDEPPKRKAPAKAKQPKAPRKAGGAGVQVAPAAGDEKRVDPADGQSYTKADFMACYGGLAEWNKAAPRTPPPAPKGRGRGIGSTPYPTAKRGRGAGVTPAAPAGRGAPFRGPNKGGKGKGAKGSKGGKGGKGGKGRR